MKSNSSADFYHSLNEAQSLQSLAAIKLFSYFIFESSFTPSSYCKNYHYRSTNFKGLTEESINGILELRDQFLSNETPLHQSVCANRS